MVRFFSLVLAVVVGLPMQATDLAPSGTLRAAFIGDNPVQGRVDPQTGAVTGLAADLVRELARRLGVPYAIVALPNPAAVIDAVQTRKADLGFLAYEAERAEQVDFSEPYVLSPGAYLVRTDSRIRSSEEVDQVGVRIGAIKGQAPQIHVSGHVKHARVEVLPTAPSAAAVALMLVNDELDAFAANRQRMEDAARTSSMVRVLPDNFMVTAQAIVVDKGHRSRVDEINRFLADVRGSGLLKASIDRAGLGGVVVAPQK